MKEIPRSFSAQPEIEVSGSAQRRSASKPVSEKEKVNRFGSVRRSSRIGRGGKARTVLSILSFEFHWTVCELNLSVSCFDSILRSDFQSVVSKLAGEAFESPIEMLVLICPHPKTSPSQPSLPLFFSATIRFLQIKGVT